ncbi:MAG: hypothetical protein LC107_01795 [Chitinophagales bacterium]|nr:hypothetical protein [Chitinophagales bacterium]
MMTYLDILHDTWTPIAIIKDIRGASGLMWVNQRLYIVSDNSHVLYEYQHLHNRQLRKISLNPHGTLEEHLDKAIKPDFEACCHVDEKVFILGSGSAEGRFEMVVLDHEFNFLHRASLRHLYDDMMACGAIDPSDFNIEGIVVRSNKAWFFNRGNGPNQRNGIFVVENWWTDSFKVLDYRPIILPDIEGYATTFSDAALIDDTILFLATAEKTNSVYDDGEIVGSGFGVLHLKSLEVERFEVLTKRYKLEGLAIESYSDENIHLILCDDADNLGDGTNIFSLRLERKYQNIWNL